MSSAESGFPDPDVLAQEIVEDLEAALEQLRVITKFYATTYIKNDVVP